MVNFEQNQQYQKVILENCTFFENCKSKLALELQTFLKANHLLLDGKQRHFLQSLSENLIEHNLLRPGMIIKIRRDTIEPWAATFPDLFIKLTNFNYDMEFYKLLLKLRQEIVAIDDEQQRFGRDFITSVDYKVICKKQADYQLHFANYQQQRNSEFNSQTNKKNR